MKFTLIAALGLASCATNTRSIYGDFNILGIDGNNVYEFGGSGAGKLLIYIEGSGTTSVLGEIRDGKWASVNFGYFITRYCAPRFPVLLVEKLGIGIGENHAKDRSFLRSYTVDNLAKSYAASIDGYLESNPNIDKVFIIAGSEGGLLFPRIYGDLKSKEKIQKAIILGAGGLSQLECFRVLANSPIDMPSDYREECKRIDEVVQEISSDSESIEKTYMGWPYARWSSFFPYRPLDYYADIDIPVLFYQGRKDWNSPCESVEYIETNIDRPNFEYHYVPDMGHVPDPDNELQINEYFAYLLSWLEK